PLPRRSRSEPVLGTLTPTATTAGLSDNLPPREAASRPVPRRMPITSNPIRTPPRFRAMPRTDFMMILNQGAVETRKRARTAPARTNILPCGEGGFTEVLGGAAEPQAGRAHFRGRS